MAGMIRPVKFFNKFFGLIFSASLLLGVMLAMVIGLSLLIWWWEHPEQALDFTAVLYMSCITALTVGYGDIVPKTPVGRICAILLGTIGIVFMGVIVGAVIKALERTK